MAEHNPTKTARPNAYVKYLMEVRARIGGIPVVKASRAEADRVFEAVTEMLRRDRQDNRE